MLIGLVYWRSWRTRDEAEHEAEQAAQGGDAVGGSFTGRVGRALLG